MFNQKGTFSGVGTAQGLKPKVLSWCSRPCFCLPDHLSSPLSHNSPYTAAKLFPTLWWPHSLLLKLFCCLEYPCLQFLVKNLQFFQNPFWVPPLPCRCQALTSKAEQKCQEMAKLFVFLPSSKLEILADWGQVSNIPASPLGLPSSGWPLESFPVTIPKRVLICFDFQNQNSGLVNDYLGKYEGTQLPTQLSSVIWFMRPLINCDFRKDT